ncbi:Ig domain-containing protein [Histomonas meleagridis]|uniref:Ig domain-containing protein n=1 Tax=Histomonas meleagridis TaxID=135588 RepID=UPI00355A7F27|nr:Ig domain-containing protein [Histomonas meleagridis]KAH0798316.1 Ig domain-containing protein [Histomonas meleagridis]
MEGGNFTSGGITYKFDALGQNPQTKEQIIHVTPITTRDFNNFTLDQMKNYDVIVVGIWDFNGGPLDFPSSETVQRVSDYIDQGYGFLLGHDSIGFYYGNDKSYGPIADKFGIKLGTEICLFPTQCSSGTLESKWKHWSREFNVTKRGLLTNYPYQIPSGILPINLTHTCSNAAFGDVWMEMGAIDVPIFESLGDFSEAEATKWENLYGYDETRYGNPHYYLTTYMNTAMVQAGHTNCITTEYERKVIANTIYYLYQKTPLQYSYDNSVTETPKLNNPIINRIGKERSLEIFSENQSEEIHYKVVGQTFDGNTKYSSEDTLFNLVTYPVEYYYVIDKSQSTIITENMSNVHKTKGNITNIENDHVYIHVASIDNFGYISNTTHFFMKADPTNTFTRSNTFTNSNTFTKSNTFNLINKSLYISETITKSMVVEQTILSHSLMLSANTYVAVESVYYKYTIVDLSTVISFYSHFYTYDKNQNSNQEDNNTTTIIMVYVCVAVVAIAVISILVYVIKRSRNIAESSDSNEMTNQDLSFAATLQMRQAEEDPFAKDFREDEYFNKL